MSIKIEIFGEDYREALRELAGFSGGIALPGETCAPVAQPVAAPEPEAPAAPEPQEPAAAEAPKRERGKPSPGRARRTKEEIAEDEAADKTDAAAAEQTEPQPNITAEPENRVDPAEAEQDAEDEAADEANAPAPEATRDDVRAAMLAYQAAYGTPALMADMSTILNEEYPAGGVTKLSEIPDTPADFAKITARLNDALASNTFSREKV